MKAYGGHRDVSTKATHKPAAGAGRGGSTGNRGSGGPSMLTSAGNSRKVIPRRRAAEMDEVSSDYTASAVNGFNLRGNYFSSLPGQEKNGQKDLVDRQKQLQEADHPEALLQPNQAYAMQDSLFNDILLTTSKTPKKKPLQPAHSADPPQTPRTRHRFSKNFALIIQRTSATLQLNPSDTKARLLRASAFMRVGDLSPEETLVMYAKAVADYSRVINSRPIEENDKREAYYYRGRGYQQLGKVPLAIADFSQVLDGITAHSYLTINAAYARASCHNIEGNFDQAIADYEMALQQDKPHQGLRNANYTTTPVKYNNNNGSSSDNGQGRGGTATAMQGTGDAGARRKLEMWEKEEESDGEDASLRVGDGRDIRGGKNSQQNMLSYWGTQQQEQTHSHADNKENKAQKPKNLLEKQQEQKKREEKLKNSAIQPKNSSKESRQDPFDENSNSNEHYQPEGQQEQQKDQLEGQPSTSTTSAHAPNTPTADYQSEIGLELSTIDEVSEIDEDSPSRKPPRQHANNPNYPQDSIEQLHLAGLKACQTGRFYHALAVYDKVVAINPRHFRAHFNRGFAFHQLGRIEEAIAAYTKAVAIEPNAAFAFYNRGIAYDRNGQLNEAVSDFTTAITLSSQSRSLTQTEDNKEKEGQAVPPDFYHNRGYSYTKLGKHSLAIQDYTTTISLSPSHFKAFISRAIAYEEVAKLEEVKTDTKDTKNDQSQNQNQAPAQTTCTQVQRGYLEKAVFDYTKGLELRPNSVVTREARCIVLQKLSEFTAAMKDIKKAIDMARKHKAKTDQFLTNNPKENDAKKLKQLNKWTSTLCGLLNTRGLLWGKLHHVPSAAQAPFASRAKDGETPSFLKNAIKDFTAAITLTNPNPSVSSSSAAPVPHKHPLTSATSSTLSSLYYNRGVSSRDAGRLEEAVLDYTYALTYLLSPYPLLYRKMVYLSPPIPNPAANAGNAANGANGTHGFFDLGFKLLHMNQTSNLDSESESESESETTTDKPTDNKKPGSEGSTGEKETASSIKVRVGEILGSRAFALRSLGYLSQSVIDYSALLRLCSESNLSRPGMEGLLSLAITSVVNRAYVYALLGDYTRACRDYGFVIKLDSNNIHAYFNRGVCYDKSSSYREAVDDFTKVIIMVPHHAIPDPLFVGRAYYNRGHAYAALGRTDLATKDKETAKSIGYAPDKV